MPALSLAQINTQLEAYAPTDGTFLPRINQTLARIYNMGTYRDLTVQFSLPVEQGAIRLPETADAVLHAIVDGSPGGVRSMWHDLKQVGSANNSLAWGLVDSGFTPVLLLLEVATSILYLVPSAESATQEDFIETNGSWVDIAATDAAQRYRVTTNADLTGGNTLTFSAPVTYIDAIRFSGLTDSFDIRTTAADASTTIATVGPGTGATRYRVFRVPNVENGKIVTVLCKRAFAPLVVAEDITYVGNINAIKQGLLATIAEDAGDVERAHVFWNATLQLMEEEMSSSRGAAQPRLNLDPSGAGSLSGLTGMM
tara:strand:+ start:251 stop:1186 length:936 start_codon:yes stop_codon:yes gene_type:complete